MYRASLKLRWFSGEPSSVAKRNPSGKCGHRMSAQPAASSTAQLLTIVTRVKGPASGRLPGRRTLSRWTRRQDPRMIARLSTVLPSG
jgi:hypothetical protein